MSCSRVVLGHFSRPEVTGAYFDYSGGAYTLAPTFSRLMKLVAQLGG